MSPAPGLINPDSHFGTQPCLPSKAPEVHKGERAEGPRGGNMDASIWQPPPSSSLTSAPTNSQQAEGWRGRRCCAGPTHLRASSFPVSTAPASIFQEDEWVTEAINLPQLLLRSQVPRSCAPHSWAGLRFPRRAVLYTLSKLLCRGAELSPLWLVKGAIESRRPLARLPVCIVTVGGVSEHLLRPLWWHGVR